MIANPLLNLIIAGLVMGLGLWVFWPERGLLWRWQRARHLTRRVLIEDALKHIYDYTHQGHRPTLQSIAGALRSSGDDVADLLTEMQAHEFVVSQGDTLTLTPAGHDYALHIIRAHRLWERYLADNTGVEAAEWHSQSDRREHHLSPAETDALAAALGHPRYDPHGDPIPTATGAMATVDQGQPLPTLPLNRPARIVHLEDEPETVFAQLLAEGLHLGMQITVTEITPQRVRFWAAGDEHVLAPVVAANISVVPLPQTEPIKSEAWENLSQLKPGQSARVVSLSPLSRGAERRRFMDLGILPGTVITAEMVSPSGDPTAYRVRGAVIGLRREQANLIQITRNVEPETPIRKTLLETQPVEITA